MAKDLSVETLAWHAEATTKVLTSLDSDPDLGLSSKEASRRLETWGPNELRKEKWVSPLSLFFNQFKNVLILILLVAVGLSMAIGEVLDAAIIVVIVLLSTGLGFFQEYKAERALQALKKMLSPMVTVLRDGREEEIPSRNLVPGDILLLEAGDKIAADARLLEVHALECDEATLTGESIPVRKETDPLGLDILVPDRKNMVFAGTVVTYGRAKAVVTATGMATEFGRIAEQVAATEAKKTPLEKRTSEIGKWLGLTSLAICFLVVTVITTREALIGKITMEFAIQTVMFAVALAVAAVPEALAAIVTGALAIGMHQMAKRNALVRKMPAVETLGCATVICSDKTGTITKGEMTVRKIWVAHRTINVTGAGYEPRGELQGEVLLPLEKDTPLQELLQAALLCNDSQLEEIEGRWVIKGDPTEGALLVVAAKAGIPIRETRLKNLRLEEIPFSSERKRMTTVHKGSGSQRVAFMKGAPEEVLSRCTSLLTEKGIVPLAEPEKKAILQVNLEMAGTALRVLGVASKILPPGRTRCDETDEQEMVFLGLLGMMDPPREEAIEAVRTCKRIHIKPIMITGDHEITAVTIAREIGIFEEGDIVLNGQKLASMSEEELEKIVDRVTVYARVSPIDKLKIVRAWKRRGEVVAMTGDGVNDAPALKQADIGVAMGITGTEVTKDASDLVLADDNFATILKAIERGRWIYDNIKKYLTYLLRCNITEVLVIGGIVLIKGPDYFPLLAAAILYINLATDGLPALALGVSPPDPDIMERPPRNPRESVFSADVLAFMVMALALETPFLYFLFFHELNSNIAQARTEIFFFFIIVELVVALNFRSLRFSLLQAPPHRWLVLAILYEILLISILVQVPSIRESFGILKPTASGLAIILGFSLVVFLGMEAIKAILRRKLSRNPRLRRPGESASPPR